MEREVLLSGIGGQGVQLAAQVLAEACLAEGRDVQLFGSYGGMMRGGNTDATVVVADDRVTSPPTVGSAWGAVVLHHEYARGVLARVRPDGVVLVNTSVWEGPPATGPWRRVAVPATQLAQEAGSPMAAAMVLLGALAAHTGLVTPAALAAAARACVPAYRTQHLAGNERALDAGAAAVEAGAVAAWPAAPARS